ncbi:MAG: hypothetical protein K940chlam7_01844 [Chlamydiae bacterium]|nr:hypothetical protein [Chlamydiota bacterium]
MKNQFGLFIILILLAALPSTALSECEFDCYEGDLMRDLMIVESVNRCLNERMPIYYNHLLQGGYFNMPSARMGTEGEIGVGFSYVPPYHNYNLRFQFLDHMEISGNYRVFSGIDDPLLSPTGFGDLSDKGVNVKFALMHPEDTNYRLPGIAVGFEDFMGTKGFEARYVVATQVFPGWNLEMSLGYGEKRIRGWFGGVMWVPFRKFCNPYFQDIALVAEYDAIPYKSKRREPHPDGRTKNSPINFGVKYRLWNLFDFSLSYVRGDKLAFSASTFYNFGLTKGLIPKVDDVLPYKAPANTQPLGPLRSNDVLVQDILYPLRDQGFDLQEAWLSYDHCGKKILRLQIVNCTYRYERDVRYRLNDLLANLIPSDISEVIVVLEDDGLPVQEYRYSMNFVRLYADKKVCPYELYLLSPLCEVSCPDRCHSRLLFKNKKDWWNIEIFPKMNTMFGSAKGKYKYSLGINLGINGYLFNDWYYSIVLGKNFASNLYDVKDVDKLNPSQLINVRTDAVNYYKQDDVTVDEAYIQKDWNICRGWFTRIAGGLFEEAYGGVASEFLYYPVGSCWAVGVEGAYLRKRTFSGIGFSDKIRKLEGFRPTFQRFRGSQYFANLWVNVKEFDIDLNVKAGRFLAKDWGVRTELSRHYLSGMQVYFWYTYTDGRDKVNGNRYHDKGVGIALPLDIFYTHTSRHKWNYGISAWLRDVGAIALTGRPLYYTIRENRENYIR